MTRFAEIVGVQRNNKIVLFRAVAAGQRFYAYIKCTEKSLHKMKRDFETGATASAASYGEVLYLRTGEEPDEEAKAWLKANGG